MYSLGRESCRGKPVGMVRNAALEWKASWCGVECYAGAEGEFVRCGIAALSTLILCSRAMKWI
ncbi:hypothetical protein MKY19_04355 [Paenibacillus sp. FSL R5-0744]|uniref:hypothetical protein n=1 Tax=Paenibacillus sp. FSL R5-0744 TaxID=2921656 RepID=UPI0030D91878